MRTSLFFVSARISTIIVYSPGFVNTPNLVTYLAGGKRDVLIVFFILSFLVSIEWRIAQRPKIVGRRGAFLFFAGGDNDLRELLFVSPPFCALLELGLVGNREEEDGLFLFFAVRDCPSPRSFPQSLFAKPSPIYYCFFPKSNLGSGVVECSVKSKENGTLFCSSLSLFLPTVETGSVATKRLEEMGGKSTSHEKRERESPGKPR